MQSKFTGDKPDFAKYGLLRFLTGLTDPKTKKADLKLGIVWYLTPDDCCSSEGRKTSFLCDTTDNHRKFRDLDPPLWDALKALVDGGDRCVHKIPDTGILPEGPKPYDVPLQFPPFMLRPARKEYRNLWIAGAKQAVSDADIVFLDPDTGIAPEEKKLRKEGPKYAYISDIEEFWGCGKSVVIYQHPGRKGEDERIKKKRAWLRGVSCVKPIDVYFTGLMFFVLPQADHRDRIERRVQRMCDDKKGWGRHFSCPTLQNQGEDPC